MKLKLLLLAMLLLLTAQARADDLLLEYSFTGQSVSPTTVAANLSGSTVTIADSTAVVTVGNSSPVSSGYSDSYVSASKSYYLSSSHWTGSPANSFQFTVAPDPGYEVSLSLLEFGYYTSSTGPTAYSVIIGDGTAITGSITPGAWALLSIPVTADIIGGTQVTISFSGASTLSGAVRLDDIALIGAIVAVPEPVDLALMAGASMLGLCLFRRLRRNR